MATMVDYPNRQKCYWNWARYLNNITVYPSKISNNLFYLLLLGLGTYSAKNIQIYMQICFQNHYNMHLYALKKKKYHIHSGVHTERGVSGFKPPPGFDDV
jgi:hypothetical protein